jgi:hypothetical protein
MGNQEVSEILPVLTSMSVFSGRDVRPFQTTFAEQINQENNSLDADPSQSIPARSFSCLFYSLLFTIWIEWQNIDLSYEEKGIVEAGVKISDHVLRASLWSFAHVLSPS